jgi:hypothetical protein
VSIKERKYIEVSNRKTRLCKFINERFLIKTVVRKSQAKQLTRQTHRAGAKV